MGTISSFYQNKSSVFYACTDMKHLSMREFSTEPPNCHFSLHTVNLQQSFVYKEQ